MKRLRSAALTFFTLLASATLGMTLPPASPLVVGRFQTVAPTPLSKAAADLLYQAVCRPEKYGAKHNGTADDTTAVQTAVNAASNAGGGTVQLVGATYKIAGTIVLPSNVRLRGASSHSSILASSSTTADTVQIGTSGTGANWASVEDVGFTPSVTKTAGSEIDALNYTCVGLRRLEFTGCYRGMMLGSVASQGIIGWVQDIRMFGYTEGIHVLHSLDVWFSNLSIDTHNLSGTGVIFDGGVESCNIVQSDIVNSATPDASKTGYSFYAKAILYTTSPPQYDQFSTVYFDSHNVGAWIDGGRHFTFGNDWFSTRPGSGVNAINFESLTFDGCRFENCGGHGLFASTGTDLLVSACQALGNNLQNNSSHGFAFNGVTNLQLLGNRSRSQSGFGSQYAGMFIDQCTNVQRIGNNCQGNANNAYLIGTINGSNVDLGNI